MARPVAPGVGKHFITQPSQPKEPIYIVEARLNGGMSTAIDPADLPGQTVVLAKNARVSDDYIKRRPGSVVYTPTAPNSEPVLLFTQFKRFDGTTLYIRFSSTKIHITTGSAWTEIVGTGYSASIENRPRICILNDRFFFAAGAEIQEIDFTGLTYADLGNAPEFTYIFGFFNRLNGANLAGSSPNPILLGRSGDLNFAEWNPSTDISAGSDPLLEAQGDFSDPITGAFGFAAVTLILRERSLWFVTKRPVASAPYTYTAAFPYVGCDAPNSATQKRDGITWYDRRTNQVYDFSLGGQPTPIGDAIQNELERIVTDPMLVQGTYDPGDNRYYLTVLSKLSTEANTFIFDYGTGSWTWDSRNNITGAFALDGGNVSLMIDQLVGNIDDLVGDIDDLVSAEFIPPAIYYTGTDGRIFQENPNSDYDYADTAFSMELESKIFANPRDDWSVTRLLVKVQEDRPGAIAAYYSKDGSDWKFYKTVSVGADGRALLKFPKHINSSEYRWKLVQSVGTTNILEYRLEGYGTGQTRSI
jgi:hypothetical protein